MSAYRVIVNHRYVTRVVLKRSFGIRDNFIERPTLKGIKKVENSRLQGKLILGHIHTQAHHILALHELAVKPRYILFCNAMEQRGELNSYNLLERKRGRKE
jgi:hypothetical protein